MSELIIWTLDWVPEGPRGFVRDLRLRWACEEAGLAYSVRTIPFDGRETNHLLRQPFGQVPFLDDGEVKLFESGACLLHLARKSEKLIPQDASDEAATQQWVIAALNSIEMVTVPLVVLGDLRSEGQRPWSVGGQPSRPTRGGAGGKGLARCRSLHRGRPAHG
jgi:glutathione S-transferase